MGGLIIVSWRHDIRRGAYLLKTATAASTRASTRSSPEATFWSTPAATSPWRSATAQGALTGNAWIWIRVNEILRRTCDAPAQYKPDGYGAQLGKLGG